MASLTPKHHDDENLPTTPATIHPSHSELRNARLSPRNLELAVRHLHRDGLIVVRDVVPHANLDALNSKMVQDALYLRSLGDKGPFNYNQGNLQQDPPPVAEYFYKSIFTNPIATQITSSILGPRPKWTFCSANSAMPPPDTLASKPQRQPVHSDADFAHPSHPFALVINVPLVTMTPSNGSTELWLGTHGPSLPSSSGAIPSGVAAQEGIHGDRASGKIKPHLLDLRRTVRGPSQPTVEKGSIIIRDLRLWHAGMPNLTPDVRVMLAMIHFAGWYRNPMRLQFAEDVRPLLEGSDLETDNNSLEIPVDWTSRDEAFRSYLGRGFGNSYDFDQEK
ncbi:phytanoyl-CoA dioxygenase family protein [Colletotrichum orchidophilum]|uniref:Phytanoyl-CoA dioxygenase family protein n=1 Tax=Colletotrichum orchidophilum TaxID=1209926 RepID=A0A1G4ATT7_9PEZI|nr:phytanoyl-CoA dioxygenase family protein [Colletotrichum orchidophilum]OHE92521.1 phytanoyl-CoA dioxygenase family protein [Colletotrichum orchidophilum]